MLSFLGKRGQAGSIPWQGKQYPQTERIIQQRDNTSSQIAQLEGNRAKMQNAAMLESQRQSGKVISTLAGGLRRGAGQTGSVVGEVGSSAKGLVANVLSHSFYSVGKVNSASFFFVALLFIHFMDAASAFSQTSLRITWYGFIFCIGAFMVFKDENGRLSIQSITNAAWIALLGLFWPFICVSISKAGDWGNITAVILVWVPLHILLFYFTGQVQFPLIKVVMVIYLLTLFILINQAVPDALGNGYNSVFGLNNNINPGTAFSQGFTKFKDTWGGLAKTAESAIRGDLWKNWLNATEQPFKPDTIAITKKTGITLTPSTYKFTYNGQKIEPYVILKVENIQPDSLPIVEYKCRIKKPKETDWDWNDPLWQPAIAPSVGSEKKNIAKAQDGALIKCPIAGFGKDTTDYVAFAAKYQFTTSTTFTTYFIKDNTVYQNQDVFFRQHPELDKKPLSRVEDTTIKVDMLVNNPPPVAVGPNSAASFLINVGSDQLVNAFVQSNLELIDRLTIRMPKAIQMDCSDTTFSRTEEGEFAIYSATNLKPNTAKSYVNTCNLIVDTDSLITSDYAKVSIQGEAVYQIRIQTLEQVEVLKRDASIKSVSAYSGTISPNAAQKEIIKKIKAEAEARGIPPEIAVAIAMQESGLSQTYADGSPVTNLKSGAAGMFQVVSTSYCPGLNVAELNDNIVCGMIILAAKCDEWGVGGPCTNGVGRYAGCEGRELHDWEIAIQGYVGWMDSCDGYHDGYVSKVMSIAKQLKEKGIV